MTNQAALEEHTQTCRRCNLTKPLSDYFFRKDSQKHQTLCKTCWHNDQMVRNYGIGLDEYERMLEEQQGVCAICGLEQNSKRNTRLCVDHCHDTGSVRGLLCDRCNRGIGLLQDDYRILNKASDYLRRFTQE